MTGEDNHVVRKRTEKRALAADDLASQDRPESGRQVGEPVEAEASLAHPQPAERTDLPRQAPPGIETAGSGPVETAAATPAPESPPLAGGPSVHSPAQGAIGPSGQAGQHKRRRRRPRRGRHRFGAPQTDGRQPAATAPAAPSSVSNSGKSDAPSSETGPAGMAIQVDHYRMPAHSVDWNGRLAESPPPGETPLQSLPSAQPLAAPDKVAPPVAASPAPAEAQPAAGRTAAGEKGRRRRSRRRSKGAAAPQPATEVRIGHGHEMLISVNPGEECRIAMTRDGRLEELFLERASAESHVGNIYKGRVTNVEPSIQAAFVDFGLTKNGFLHISDIVPQYFPGHDGEPEEIGRKTPRRDRPPIQRCLRRGQEVIVQITKEGIGTKGPTLTTYISVPGRFLVMMPGMNRLGVSRKIEEDEARRKMREVLNQLELPKGMGFILRTAGLDRTKRELQQDLNYLTRLWKTVTERTRNEKAPATLYQESDLAIRTVRDTLENDVERVIVDDQATAQKIRDFLAIAMPNAADKVQVYEDPEPLFHRYGIEKEIDKLHGRYVPLSSGGSLVIDSTEALVAIDVNSGRYRDQDDAEETALRINMEAAEEIARQLRLRDLGGVIVCDFIDMRLDRNRRAVEKALRDALKRHKERAKILRMSRFGMIEMTRQRTRPSISKSMHQDCPHCQGSGMVKTPESTILDVMRMLQLAAHRESVRHVEVQVSPEVAFQLQNRKRRAICDLETRTDKTVVVRANPGFGLDRVEYLCQDARGQVLKFP
jgi:ribonuclease E